VSEVTHHQPRKDYKGAMREAKRELILKTLQQTGGNFTEAAKLLCMHANNLHRLVRTLKIRDN